VFPTELCWALQTRLCCEYDVSTIRVISSRAEARLINIATPGSASGLRRLLDDKTFWRQTLPEDPAQELIEMGRPPGLIQCVTFKKAR